MAQATFDLIQQIIVDRFGAEQEKVAPDLEIQKDLGADSLDVVELVMELEDLFNLKIEDEAVESIVTVQDIVKYIDAKKKINKQ